MVLKAEPDKTTSYVAHIQATSKICTVHNTEDSRQRADKNTIIICISTLHLYSISSMFFQIQNRTVRIIATCLNKLSLNSTTPHIVTHPHRLITPTTYRSVASKFRLVTIATGQIIKTTRQITITTSCWCFRLQIWRPAMEGSHRYTLVFQQGQFVDSRSSTGSLRIVGKICYVFVLMWYVTCL